jgi:DNA-binding PadR family transcriptional regulator
MQPPTRGFVQSCLLLLLTEGPLHGYRLMEELTGRQLLGNVIAVGNLYRTLRRMEAEGLVESTWSGPRRRPRKRVYQITQRGIKALRLWTELLEQRMTLMNRFLDEYRNTIEPVGVEHSTEDVDDTGDRV